jgi:tripartite ATP-independent transporter DctM subunit
MLVIMGDLVGLSVGSLFMAAVVPGLLMSGLYVAYIITLGALRPKLAPSIHVSEGPSSKAELWKMVLRSFLPPSFLIGLVLGSIFAGWATPTEASGVGALGAILLAIFNRQFSMKVLREVMYSSARTNAMVFFIVFGATMFSYVFRALGGDDVVVELLAAMGLDTGWEVLIFVMSLVFVMGFFFDWIEICLIIIPVFGPIIGKLDFGTAVQGTQVVLVWFSILLAVNMQSAFLTPPFGFALFYMKGTVPKEVTMMHIYRGIIPFVMIQLVALALCVAYPDVVLYLPRSMGLLD